MAAGEEEDLKKRQDYNNSFHAFEHHGEMVEDLVMESSEKLDMTCNEK